MKRVLSDSHKLALDIDRFMRRFHSQTHPKALAADQENVGPLGGMVLITIAEMQPVATQDLTRQLNRDKAQMTRILQSLERKGMLSRAPSSTDGRVTMLTLTGKGIAAVADFQRVMAEVVDDLLGGISASEKAQLSRTLTKALNNPAAENE